MITKAQYEDAIAKMSEAKETIRAYRNQPDEDFKARWERFKKNDEFFTDVDLIYSAGAKCDKCGAGLAYPKASQSLHQWFCSNFLKGVFKDKGHSEYSFDFYEIKSENDPSARGATTRPPA